MKITREMETKNKECIFLLKTTIDKQFRIAVNMNISTEQLYDHFLREIEQHTIFTRDDILDVFVEHETGKVLSIPRNDKTIKDFVLMNQDYFPEDSIPNNTYTLYAIDRMYNERLSKQPEHHKSREIQTDHSSFIDRMKSRLSFWKARK